MTLETVADSAQPQMPGAAQTCPVIPPLEHGDHLTRHEFERRYHAMSKTKKAELIEGIVYMPSPVRFKGHGAPHFQIITWLGVYLSQTPGLSAGDNATVCLDPDNEPQPDVLLRREKSRGGRSDISADDYIEGAPELVVEIAGSSASYDLHEKLTAYRRNGVQEYLVGRVYEQQIDWFSLEDGSYVALAPDENSVICSRIFPGLWLDVAAMLKGESTTFLAVLQQGMAAPEHQEIVAQLVAE